MKKLILLIVIFNVFVVCAQDKDLDLQKVLGKWTLNSVNNFDKQAGKSSNPETSLFRDLIKGNSSIIFKESGELLFFKDKQQQKWKYRLVDKSTIYLIEFEQVDAKGEVSSAYIDYKIDVSGGRLRLYREDPAQKEEYIFSPVKN